MVFGKRHKGSATQFSDLVVVFEEHQGTITGRSSFTVTAKSVVMLTLILFAPRRGTNTTLLKVFGITWSRESNQGSLEPQAGALPLCQHDWSRKFMISLCCTRTIKHYDTLLNPKLIRLEVGAEPEDTFLFLIRRTALSTNIPVTFPPIRSPMSFR